MTTGYTHFKSSVPLSDQEIAEKLCRHTSYKPEHVLLTKLERWVETDKETGVESFITTVNYEMNEDLNASPVAQVSA